jgi:hypothetical protein
MAMQLQQNMGTADRLIRGLLGSTMMLNGLFNLGSSPLRKIEAGLGGLFLFYGISGVDPLLSVFGATTIPGSEGSILNRMKHALPGPGIQPQLTQDVFPKKTLKPLQAGQPLNRALSIG